MHGFTLEPYLSVADLALAAGGLAVELIVRDARARKHLVATILIFLALSCALQWGEQRSREAQVLAYAKEIVDNLGDQKRTYDDIVAALRLPDYRLASAALDLLITEGRLGSEETTISVEAGKQLHVRLYFVRTFS
jgi:hypothetical protein